MDVIDMMRADQALAETLLDGLQAESGYEGRCRSLRRTASQLRINILVEEEVFYPAFRDAGVSLADRGMLLEALEAHCIAGDLILVQLESLSPMDDRFRFAVSELCDTVRRHHAWEQTVVFARARQLLAGGKLRRLAKRAQRMRRGLGCSARIAA